MVARMSKGGNNMEKNTKKPNFIRRMIDQIKRRINRKDEKLLPAGKQVRDNVYKNTKSKDYRKSVATIAGATVLTAGTIGGLGALAVKGKQDLQSMDMSKYNIDNKKYEDYVKTEYDSEETEKENLYRLAKLEDNIRIYNSLSSGKLTDTQQETLKEAKNEIKQEMVSKLTAKVYMNMFKEKMKAAYKAEGVTINYLDGANPGKEFNVKLKTATKPETFMQKEDKTKEIKSAVWDIVELQGMQEKATYEDKDIEAFVKLYENMKGFSNLEFTKEEGKPLAMNETYKATLPDGTYTVYKMDLSDKENPEVKDKTEIEVKDGFVNDGEER